MWGSETLATEVSSTSMKVASMTDAAMTQGLAEGRQAGLAAAALSGTATGGSCSVPGELGVNEGRDGFAGAARAFWGSGGHVGAPSFNQSLPSARRRA